MTVQWNTIVSNMNIVAVPSGLWTLVHEYLPANAMVRVIAWGTWSYSDQMGICSPDGHRASFISPDRCLCKDALVGSLICKIGGGTADLKGTIVPTGSQAVFTVPEGGGSLYMTINDEAGGFEDNSGSVVVDVDVRIS